MLKVLTAILIIAATPIFAQSNNCGPREQVLQALTEQYGESRQSIGISRRGWMVETWANAETGTWTILLTDTTGKTCVADSGEGFEGTTGEVLDPARFDERA